MLFAISDPSSILLDLALVRVLHLDVLFLVLDERLRQSVDLVDHGLLLELVDVASVLRVVQVLILLSDVHEETLDEG